MTICSSGLFVNSVVPDDGQTEKNASMKKGIHPNKTHKLYQGRGEIEFVNYLNIAAACVYIAMHSCLLAVLVQGMIA
jgi:hypothetical protein